MYRLDASPATDECRALAEALAGNPNLDREQWISALEIAPNAAIRNPLLPMLLIQRTPIIVADHELVALGVLASLVTSNPADTSAKEALVCLHVQTQRHPKSATPWQNDYVFVSAALAPNVRACHPIDAGYPWSLSDHCPVVVELTPPPPPPPTPADSPSSAPPSARPRPSPRAAPRSTPPC